MYLKLPPRFITNGKKILKLKKSLYGLKQAAKIHNEALHIDLIESNFVQSDRCVYVAHTNENICYLIVHVDDMIVAATNLKFYEECLKRTKARFKVQDLGKAKHFLGSEIKKNEGDFNIAQSKYIGSCKNFKISAQS